MKKFKHQDEDMERFKDHVITVIEEYSQEPIRGEFIWGKPGTCIYQGHIIFRPSTIILYGDLGTWVFRQSGIDMAWLRGAIRSPDYMLSKLTDERRKVYDEDRTKEFALECIQERLEDIPIDRITDWRIQVRRADWSDMNNAYNFFSDELVLDGAECICETWDAAGGMWPWLVLKTFMERYDAGKKVKR